MSNLPHGKINIPHPERLKTWRTTWRLPLMRTDQEHFHLSHCFDFVLCQTNGHRKLLIMF